MKRRTPAERAAGNAEFTKTLNCLCQDALRYRWLTSGRTDEVLEKAHKDAVQPTPVPQDRVICELGLMYYTKAQMDAIVDAAMAQSA